MTVFICTYVADGIYIKACDKRLCNHYYGTNQREFQSILLTADFPPDGLHDTRNACGPWRIASWTTWYLL